jgi:hypothetical protein
VRKRSAFTITDTELSDIASTAVTIMRKVDINFVEISEADVLPLAQRRIVFAIRAQPKAESTYANYKEEQHGRSTEFLRWSGKP